MNTATLSKEELNGIDFDALENAVVAPANKKQIIIDHIRDNGIPSAGPDLALFQNDGIVIKDDFASYLGNVDFYSTGSFAKLANGTPLDWLYDTMDGLKAELEKYKDRSSFELGTFVHEAILEPEKWDSVVCEPQASRASHEGLDTLLNFWDLLTIGPGTYELEMPKDAKLNTKKEVLELLIAGSGKRAIDMKSALIVQRLHERWKAYQNGLWAGILNAAHREVSIYCNDYIGMPMRVRPDGLLFADQIGVNAVVSVKTTAATSVKQYARDFVKFGYDIKEAAYQKIVSKVTGVDFSTTIMIVLSTAEPFHVGVFILDDGEMKFANQRFETAVMLAHTCNQMDSYPGWEGVEEMGIIDLNVY